MDLNIFQDVNSFFFELDIDNTCKHFKEMTIFLARFHWHKPEKILTLNYFLI